ncbi:ribosome-binding factor A [Corallococcus sp. bb12-1]|uniref:ribosome-binding factor A n=1 Tax=Corallococcus sp. bb12-1 TaxID=2996784 RepID=UPI00227063D6|nr:ribosome-binding factor A [Corallococcus sp. bb12-1]MCY1040601.1 ribosome-binding factor A [Corallococcus sp. bb12-1]
MSSSRSRRPRASSRRSGSSLFQSQAPSARHLRVQSTLSEEVSLLFRGELSDPLLEGVALTSFELSPEGRTARIGYTLSEDTADPAQVKEALLRAQGYLRSQLAQHLNLKRTPNLRFVHVGTAPRTEHDDSGWGSDDEGEGGDA